jgi:hypothetical protein
MRGRPCDAGKRAMHNAKKLNPQKQQEKQAFGGPCAIGYRFWKAL